MSCRTEAMQEAPSLLLGFHGKETQKVDFYFPTTYFLSYTYPFVYFYSHKKGFKIGIKCTKIIKEIFLSQRDYGYFCFSLYLKIFSSFSAMCINAISYLRKINSTYQRRKEKQTVKKYLPEIAFSFLWRALCYDKSWFEIYRLWPSNCMPNGNLRYHIMPEKSRNAVLLFAVSPSNALKDSFYNPQFGNKLTNNKNTMTLGKTQWPTKKMAKSCLPFHSLHLEAIKHLALCFCLWCQIGEVGGIICETDNKQPQLDSVQAFKGTTPLDGHP